MTDGTGGTREIYHLALVDDWSAAQEVGEFRISSRDRTLEQEGFIHFSGSHEQLAGVRQRFYADVTEPMVVLVVDPALLPSEIVWEAPAPGVPELFPHLYGPLPVAAVVAAVPLAQFPPG